MRTRIAGGTISRAFGLTALAVAAMLPVGAASVAAQTPAAPQTQQPLDSQVAQALRNMSATLAAAPELTVRLTGLREVPLSAGGDQNIMLGSTVAVGIRRPGRLAALVGSDNGSYRLWYDGEAATLFSLTANAFARVAIPGNDIEAFLEALEEQLGVEIPLRDLLAPDPYAALIAAPTSGAHVGRTVVNGALCDQYALRNGEVDWQIWIAVGARPLPCRMVVIDRTAPTAPRTILEFADWNLSPRLANQAFDFVAPADARQVAWIARSAQPRPSTEVR